MSEWKNKKIGKENINGGLEYKEGDGIYSDDLNAIVSNVLWEMETSETTVDKLNKKANALIKSFEGESLELDTQGGDTLFDLEIYGKTILNGEPSIENPATIMSVGNTISLKTDNGNDLECIKDILIKDNNNNIYNLNGFNNRMDTIVSINGEYYINKQTEKRILNGQETYYNTPMPSHPTYALFEYGNYAYMDEFICNKFARENTFTDSINQYVPTKECCFFSTTMSSIHFVILKSRLTSNNSTGFKQWLANNNIEIIASYKKANFKSYKLDSLESIKLNELMTYNNTYLTSTNSIIPIIKGKYSSVLDSVPTYGSDNFVKSGGVHTALAGKADLVSGKVAASQLNIDTTPTSGSNNLITSGGTYDALDLKQDKLQLDAYATPGSNNPVKSSGLYEQMYLIVLAKGQNGGFASLDDNGKVPISQLPLDSTPISGSTNPITSGGTYDALALKAPLLNPTFSGTVKVPDADQDQEAVNKGQMDTALSAKQNTLTFDDAPTNGSNNPVKSSGVFTAIATAISDLGTLKRLMGAVATIDDLPSDAALGDVYIVGETHSPYRSEYIKISQVTDGQDKPGWEKYGDSDVGSALEDYYTKEQADIKSGELIGTALEDYYDKDEVDTIIEGIDINGANLKEGIAQGVEYRGSINLQSSYSGTYDFKYYYEGVDPQTVEIEGANFVRWLVNYGNWSVEDYLSVDYLDYLMSYHITYNVNYIIDSNINFKVFYPLIVGHPSIERGIRIEDGKLLIYQKTSELRYDWEIKHTRIAYSGEQTIEEGYYESILRSGIGIEFFNKQNESGFTGHRKHIGGNYPNAYIYDSAIIPNRFRDFGLVEYDLPISYGAFIADVNDVVLEYCFQFQTGATAPTVTMPADIIWVGGEPTIEANMIYQCSIVNNIGVIVGVPAPTGV